MYFDDFRTNFCNFFYFCFVLLPKMGTEKSPVTWTIFSLQVAEVLLI